MQSIAWNMQKMHWCYEGPADSTKCPRYERSILSIPYSWVEWLAGQGVCCKQYCFSALCHRICSARRSAFGTVPLLLLNSYLVRVCFDRKVVVESLTTDFIAWACPEEALASKSLFESYLELLAKTKNDVNDDVCWRWYMNWNQTLNKTHWIHWRWTLENWWC